MNIYAGTDVYYWTNTWYRDNQVYIIMTVTGFPIITDSTTYAGLSVRATHPTSPIPALTPQSVTLRASKVCLI